jgi:glutaminyl-peptide cyclotransferase
MTRGTGRVARLVSAGALLAVVMSAASQGRDEFAQDRPPEAGPAPFDPERAMGYLKDVCKLGPRPSGSDGMKKQQELLEAHFKKHGGEVRWQRFEAKQRSQKAKTPMANLVVRWNPDAKRRVILCTHYDTRPVADQEPDPRKWRDGFVGANDGGSGVALLMELGHAMKDLKTAAGVDFVFFDGEEFIHERDDAYFFGSRHFAEAYRKEKDRKYTYTAAVLLDMVAGKKASFPVEGNSWFLAGALVREVWGIADEQKCGLFEQREGRVIDDDHVPLNRAGIPAVDIIDLEYRHWHRLSDVPENCSGETMEQVARVVSVWVQRAK